MSTTMFTWTYTWRSTIHTVYRIFVVMSTMKQGESLFSSFLLEVLKW
jgi:hypothetical protein